MPPVNKPLFHDHIKQLVLPTTQIQVIAVATVFSVPVYYCQMSEDNVCHREVTYPIKNATVHDDVFQSKVSKPHHFELFYWNKVHYDCVVSLQTGECSSSVPVLSGTESFIDITL